MEVIVYENFEARSNGKSVFHRAVQCPDAFDYNAFIKGIRSIFGEKVVIEFLVC